LRSAVNVLLNPIIGGDVMAKGRRDPQWRDRVRECEASGKSAKVWCQENKIPLTTLAGWKKRLKISRANSVGAKSGFIELKEQVQSDPGIILECNGIKIHLRAKFDKGVLKQCLDCLRGTSC
jgi:hypothetical protein